MLFLQLGNWIWGHLCRLARKGKVLYRSWAVGLVPTVLDQVTLLVLIKGCGVPELIANFPSMIPGLIFLFYGTKYFAFGDQSRQTVRQGALFVLIEAGAFLLNLALFDLLVRFGSVHFVLARALGTFLTFVGFSFPLWSLFVFRQGARESEPERPAETVAPVVLPEGGAD